MANNRSYGQLGYYFIVDLTDDAEYDMSQKWGEIYDPTAGMILQDDPHNLTAFQFLDSPPGGSTIDTFSAYSNRTIEVTHACSSWQVRDLSQVNQTTYLPIEVPTIGNITMPVTANVTTFFTDANNTCGPRCGIIESLEVTADASWYYTCNITMSETKNDPNNYSTISDEMAQIAVNSIAETILADVGNRSYQIYPLESSFGVPVSGSAAGQGGGICVHALGAIVGAAWYNRPRIVHGRAPGSGQILKSNHYRSFERVLAALAGFHLLLAVICSILSNRVELGPDGHVGMSMLLKPVAETLQGVSGGEKNQAYKLAKRHTQVRYEPGPDGKWGLNMLA